MEQNQLLQNNAEFAGHTVIGKLSRHHDGEREVYRAIDGEGREVALTVFDIRCQRYASDCGARKRHPDFIEEVRFFRKCADAAGHNDIPGLPKYLGSGISSCNRHRYGWLAMEYIDGESLEMVIGRQRVIAAKDAFDISRKISFAISATAGFFNGGGHYNISPDNIIVRYTGNELADVRLIGFANMGHPYSGNSSVNEKELDIRFRAPETFKGIYNHRSDVYSLGLLLLFMLTGFPKEIVSGQLFISPGNGISRMIAVSSIDFHRAFWKNADKSLSNTLRLVLRKATDLSPAGRFASIDKFIEFLGKVEKKEIKSQSTSKEKDREDNKPKSGYVCGPPQRFSHIVEYSKLASDCEESDLPKGPEQKTALDDVAGMAELKALFRRDFISIVRNPEVANAYGIKPSNCTLLYGPQGCGKTFIAEKAAQESGLRYKVINPSDLGSIYVHGSQQKISELFDEAEKRGPMILIFDEFDAIVPKRDRDLSGNQANEVNEMLTQLNNCASRGIYVLATTNRPGLLDPAIMRKGRIDRIVYVSLPDEEARAELFRLEIEKRPYENIDYKALAKATDNYTCSDISFIVEESARLCFEETLERKTEKPIPISMNRLTEVIKTTHPSVSEAQRKEYLDLKARMEDIQQTGDRRKKVGFNI